MKAIKNTFTEGHNATVGFDFFTFCTLINEATSCKLQIWDTCGQETYKSLITSFYRNTSLAMMVYSIDSQESFEHIKTWHRELKIQSSAHFCLWLILLFYFFFCFLFLYICYSTVLSSLRPESRRLDCLDVSREETASGPLEI